MKKRGSIPRKITIPLLLSMTFLFGIFAAIQVNYIRKLVQEKVTNEAIDLIHLKAGEIQSFFVEHSKIPLTVYSDPFVLEWFANYTQFRAPVRNDPGYQKIIAYMNQVVRKNGAIKSMFFATDNTQEYFEDKGRYEEDGYLVKQRSWWHQAIKQNRLYIDVSDYDYDDGTLSSTMQLPVYNDRGRFLGIGGVDILITTVGQIIEQIKYKDQGHAFLIGENGELIYFPEKNLEVWYGRNLSAIDSIFTSANGFKELGEIMTQQKQGITEVTWKNEKYNAVYAPVRADVPYLNWKLGLIIPQNLIAGPVQKITWISILAVFIALFCLVVLTWIIVTWIVRPLDRLSARLHEMANEKSDLTKELPVESNDAIGQTAYNFNTFIGQIRDLFLKVIHNTQDVAERTTQIHKNSADISNDANEMTGQVQLMAATSDQMLHVIGELNEGIRSVARMAKQSKEAVTKGEEQIHQRIEQLENLAESITHVYKKMESLNEKSAVIVSTVSTIDEISGQISLLALNASIEAVKAGDAGKGFAVVAAEIKELSQRTAETNDESAKTLEDLGLDIESLYNSILSVHDRMSDEIKTFREIDDTFHSLQDDVAQTDDSAEQMRDRTQKQVESIREVDAHIQKISKVTEHIAKGIEKSFQEITAVDQSVKDLLKSTREVRVNLE